MADEIKRIRAVFSTDTSGFNSSLTGINKQMKVAQSELKAVGSELKAYGSTTESLVKKQDALNKQIDLHNKKIALYGESLEKTNKKLEENIKKREELKKAVENANKAYEDAVKTHGKESSEAEKAKEALNDLKDAYQRNEKAIESNIKKVADYESNINNTTAQLTALDKELKDVSKELNNQSKKWDEMGDKLQAAGDKFQTIGSGLNTAGNKMLGVGAAIGGVVGASTKYSMEFDTAMTKVNTIANVSQKDLDNLSKSMINLSNETGVSVTELADAEYQALSAGVEFGNSIEFLGKAVKLAGGGFTDTTNAVDILSTVLNAYEMEAEEVTKVSDILMQTQNKGKTTVNELAGSLGKIIPTAKAAGVNFEQVGTAMALLTSKGIATAEAVTYTNSMFTELSKSGTKVSKVLESETGKSFKQLMEEGKTLSEVLGIINQNAEANGLSMADMFGSAEAGRAAMTLLAGEGEEFSAILKEMNESSGATQEAWDKMSQTAEAKLNRSMKQLQNSFIELGGAATPIVENIAGGVNELADFIGNLTDEQIDNILQWGKFLLIGGVATKTLGGIFNTVGSVSNGLGSLSKLLGKSKIGLDDVAKGAAKTAGKMGGLSGATGLLSKGIGLATKLLNPWTLGLTAAAGGAVLVGKALSKEVVPEINVFDDVLVKSGSYLTQYGETATYTKEKISEATKEMVGAYLELDRGATESLQNLYVNSIVITEENANVMIDKFKVMGEKITGKMNEDYNEDLKILNKFFENSETLTEEEQSKVLETLKTHNDNQKKIISDAQSEITNILNKASEENRELTQKEHDDINALREGMRTAAVQALSEQEIESNAILDRMNTYDRRITAEMAGEHVKQLNEARDKAVDKANEEYRETIRIAEEMKKGGSEEAKKLADKMIEEAERQRKGVIEKADETKKKGIDKLKESYSNLEKEIDIDTGNILDFWDKIKIKFSGMGGKVSYEVETKYTTSGNPSGSVLGEGGMGVFPGLRNSRANIAFDGIPRDYFYIDNNLSNITREMKEAINNLKLEGETAIYIDGKKIARATVNYIDKELNINKRRREWGAKP